MNKFSPLIVVVFFLFLLIATCDDVVALVDDNDSTIIMTPIDSDVDQSIDCIYIDLSCDDAGSSVPNTMVTIFPSNNNDDSGGGGGGVTVETSPPNLVTVVPGGYGGLFNCENDFKKFVWNTNVSSTATSGGGVRIGIPQDQLKVVIVDKGHTVQIFDGFTNAFYLHVEGEDSILRASMTSLSNSTELELANFGGHMYVETNNPVKSGQFAFGGQTWVETPSFNSFFSVFNDGSKLNIKGDVNISTVGWQGVNGRVSDGAQLTVTGTITGNIKMDKKSTVNAPSCDNVREISCDHKITCDGSICNAGPQSVEFDVGISGLSKNSQTLNGTYTCGEDSSSSSSFPASSLAPVDDATNPSMISSSVSSFSSHVYLITILIDITIATTTMLI